MTLNRQQVNIEPNSVLYVRPHYRKCTVSRMHFEEMWNKPCAADKKKEEHDLMKQPGVSQFASRPAISWNLSVVHSGDKLALNRAVAYYIAFYNMHLN